MGTAQWGAKVQGTNCLLGVSGSYLQTALSTPLQQSLKEKQATALFHGGSHVAPLIAKVLPPYLAEYRNKIVGIKENIQEMVV